MKTKLSKSDKQLMKLSPFFKIAGLVVMLVGTLGVLVGIQKLYIIKTSYTRNYDEILTFISIGIICFGYLIFSAYRLIEKIKNDRETDEGI